MNFWDSIKPINKLWCLPQNEHRKQAARRPVRMEGDPGLDEGDETGICDNILKRDFSDWGKYTLTVASVIE